jgi:hypothetical protein
MLNIQLNCDSFSSLNGTGVAEDWNHQGVAEDLLSPPSMLLPLRGTCEPRPKYGRLPRRAGGPKNYQLPRRPGTGHREGKSIKPLPFECNLNVAGGRAKFAAPRLSLSPRLPGPGNLKDYHWHDTTVYNLRCMTERNASSERIWYGRRSDTGPLTCRLALRP